MDSIGSSGGILIMWNEVQFEIKEAIEGKFSLSLNLLLVDGFDLWITGVYDPNSIAARKLFWMELADLEALCNPNWIIGGDFNITRWSWEKHNSTSQTRGMRCFNEFYRAMSLLTLL